MSTSDPFLPFGEPPADDADDARVRDLRDDPEDDTASDLSDLPDLSERAGADDAAALDDPDAEEAAARERLHAEQSPFQRPHPGDRLTAEQLAAREAGSAAPDAGEPAGS
ncbi:hypothetical protein [Herbiconiux liangxiaofengii]|uniref:hypothetical protein n=1 Tax=Herbiconiux liangxiaofengii TaxID=3342795 RepID=UPI0035B871E1